MAKAAKPRRLRRGFVFTVAILGALLLLANCGGGPLRRDPLARSPQPLSVDAHLELARRYGPWIYHAVHPTKGRQDLPTRVDFDGNLRGDDNWEHMANFELPPTVYYALLETETHYFISYHLFHPRDWSYLRVGFNETHENDGENLQVVVDKASGRVVLLFTQAHYFGAAHADPQGPFAAGPEEEISAPLLRLGEDGRPDPAGAHAGVFVEAYGHGIYGALAVPDELQVAPDGSARFAEAGLVFRPAHPGEPIAEPALRAGAVVPYQLESTTAKLWPGVRDGSLVGEGGLLDGPCLLERDRLRVDVPRFYEADRFSGIFGSDRGISPFALSFSFWGGQIGALFFDPANRYPECLSVPEPWSREYLSYPFGPAEAGSAQ